MTNLNSMKTFLFFGLLMLACLLSHGQGDVRPVTNVKYIQSPAMYYALGDSSIYWWLGSEYRYRKIATERRLIFKVDSLDSALDGRYVNSAALGTKSDTATVGAHVRNVSTAHNLNLKVDKVAGKALSDNNFTDADSIKLVVFQDSLNAKVQKVSGKGLSTEDYSSAEKSKLAGIEAGANNYAHPANHPASIITQDASNRFVSDTEKGIWNGKQGAINGTGFVKAEGTTISYDNMSYLPSGYIRIPYWEDAYTDRMKWDGGATGLDAATGRASLGIGNINNTSDANKPISTATQTALNTKADLDGNGKVLSSQMPSIAISETFVVTSEAAMLALSTAETGDVAVRNDISKSFILTQNPSSTLANWQVLLTPAESVSSVNGQTGTVSLTTDQITEGTNKYVSASEKTAITHNNRTALDNVSGTNTGDNAANTTSNTYADGKVTDAINDGTTTIAPSQNAVFDALGGKAASSHNQAISTITGLQDSLGNHYTKAQTGALYEPVFSKNTAFNKNFGTGSGEVAQGNDSRINNGQTAYTGLNAANLTTNCLPKWDGSKFVNSATFDNGNIGIGTETTNPFGMSGKHFVLHGGSTYSFYHNRTDNIHSFWANNESAGLTAIFSYTNTPLTFGANNTEYVRLFGNGNFHIGYTTDQGYKLAVNGNAYIGGAVAATSLRIGNQYDVYGTSNTPAYATKLTMGIDNIAPYIQWGNEAANNNGSWLRFVTNKRSAGNTPAYALTLDPDGNATVGGSVAATGNYFTTATNGYWASGANNFKVGWYEQSGKIQFRTGTDGVDKITFGTDGSITATGAITSTGAYFGSNSGVESGKFLSNSGFRAYSTFSGMYFANSGTALEWQVNSTTTGMTLGATGNLWVAGGITGAGGGFNSLRKLKDIYPDWNKSALKAINEFKLRDFSYKTDSGANRTLGFIIDEIPNSVKQYVVRTDGEAVNTYTLHGLSFKAHQEESERIDKLEKGSNLSRLFDEYKQDCYNDSTYVEYTKQPDYSPYTYKETGAVCAIYLYPIKVKEWRHKQPTFDGFMSWLNIKNDPIQSEEKPKVRKLKSQNRILKSYLKDMEAKLEKLMAR